MKFLSTSAIVFSTLAVVSGCASTNSSQSWQGRPLNEVVALYGAPDSYLKVGDGEKVVEFYVTRQDSQTLSSSNCKATFLVDRNNTILSQTEGQHCL